jgi:hypothetical protein
MEPISMCPCRLPPDLPFDRSGMSGLVGLVGANSVSGRHCLFPTQLVHYLYGISYALGSRAGDSLFLDRTASCWLILAAHNNNTAQHKNPATAAGTCQSPWTCLLPTGPVSHDCALGNYHYCWVLDGSADEWRRTSSHVRGGDGTWGPGWTGLCRWIRPGPHTCADPALGVVFRRRSRLYLSCWTLLVDAAFGIGGVKWGPAYDDDDDDDGSLYPNLKWRSETRAAAILLGCAGLRPFVILVSGCCRCGRLPRGGGWCTSTRRRVSIRIIQP